MRVSKPAQIPRNLNGAVHMAMTTSATLHARSNTFLAWCRCIMRRSGGSGRAAGFDLRSFCASYLSLFRLQRGILILLLMAASSGVPYGRSFAADDAAKTLKARLTKLTEIALLAGINNVAFRAINADGKAAIRLKAKVLVLELEHAGTAGHATYISTTKGDRDYSGDWAIIPIMRSNELDSAVESISDDPHLEEDAVKVVRFFNGEVDRVPSTILLVAERDLSGNMTSDNGVTSAAPTRISVFALHKGKYPPAFFLLVGEFVTSEKYCDANYSLHNLLSAPLPHGFAAPGTSVGNGCPHL